MHWPPLSRFKRFEKRLASGQPGDFHYLNGGMWIGRTDFSRTLFERAASMAPVPEAPEIRSQVCVPLKTSEAVIGVLSAES